MNARKQRIEEPILKHQSLTISYNRVVSSCQITVITIALHIGHNAPTPQPIQHGKEWSRREWNTTKNISFYYKKRHMNRDAEVLTLRLEEKAPKFRRLLLDPTTGDRTWRPHGGLPVSDQWSWFDQVNLLRVKAHHERRTRVLHRCKCAEFQWD